MYLEYFGLGVNPFSLSPKLDFLYKSGAFEESMAHLVYGLDNQEAIVLITGAIGTGKTMTLQSFLTNLGPRFEFALITNTRVTATELLKLILEDLGVGLPIGADKSDLLILFKDYLHGANREGKMVLIVVDEAQNLEPEVLEEIRLLTNMGQGETQPVQIILVGQPELDEMVNRPDLAQIRQRIRVHYALDPLTRQETEGYLNHRMAVAGCGRKVFTLGAIDRIYQGSRGVPRLVNTLAGEALLSAFVAGHDMVQPGDVEEDRDLRFETGPTPVPVQAPEASPVPQPTAPTPPPPPAPEPPPPPVMARRGSRNGVRRIVRAWVLAALVVVVLGVLYYMGAMDGLVAAIYSNPNQQAARTPDRESIATIHEPQVKAARQAKAELEVSEVVEVGDLEVKQADIQVKTPAEIPESKPEETPEETSEKTPEKTLAATADLAGDFYVHIYSFRTPERADTFARRWDNPRTGVTIRLQEVRGVNWYRIYLGPFVTRDAALLEALRLQQDETITYYKVSTLPSGQGF
jgi:type II secretory pathway predicted ATPase ExeA